MRVTWPLASQVMPKKLHGSRDIVAPAACAHPAFARQLLPLSAAYKSPNARHVVAAASLSVPQAKGWMAAT